MKHLRILSLGAGVQSSALALMAGKEEIGPMPDAAIFADTHAEPKAVYEWLDWLEKQLPFPVYRVSAGSLTERITTNQTNQKTGKRYYSNMIPAFARNPDGSKGIVGRSCTTNFKIAPITKKLRELIGKQRMAQWRKDYKEPLKILAEAKRRKKNDLPPPPGAYAAMAECQAAPLVVQWIGISLDEVTRMKPSRDAWSRHEWPLIDARMKRHDCLLWMERNGYPEPPRSACIYCPFHSDYEWRQLAPEEFGEAVDVERKIQAAHLAVETAGKMRSTVYLHEQLVPLDQVDFTTDRDHGQMDLFQQECEGMCGV